MGLPANGPNGGTLGCVSSPHLRPDWVYALRVPSACSTLLRVTMVVNAIDSANAVKVKVPSCSLRCLASAGLAVARRKVANESMTPAPRPRRSFATRRLLETFLRQVCVGFSRFVGPCSSATYGSGIQLLKWGSNWGGPESVGSPDDPDVHTRPGCFGAGEGTGRVCR